MARRRIPGGARNRAGTGIVVHGVEQLANTMDKIGDALKTRTISRASEDAANVIMHEAKRLCPVRSGRLRASIHVEKGHVPIALERATKASRQASAKLKGIKQYAYAVICGEGFFTGDTYYSGMVEFGTVKWAGKPFMRPAAQAKKDVVRQIFRKAVRDLVKNSARRRANAQINDLTFGVE